MTKSPPIRSHLIRTSRACKLHGPVATTLASDDANSISSDVERIRIDENNNQTIDLNVNYVSQFPKTTMEINGTSNGILKRRKSVDKKSVRFLPRVKVEYIHR